MDLAIAFNFHYSNPNSDYTNGFMVRNYAKMTIISTNSDNVTSMPLLGSLP
jgi:hypothetical protein